MPTSDSLCSVDDCKKPNYLRSWCQAHYHRWRRHGNPLAGRLSPGLSLERRLEAKTVFAGKDECWLWLGERQPNGYPKIRVEGRYVTVTRIVYEQYYGRPLPVEKPLALHHCDNPPCVNPRHLWAGNHRDNMQDMKNKGRDNHARGEDNGFARLTARQVQDIRARYAAGEPQAALGTEFGVWQGHISRIVRREVWRHVA